MSQMIKVRAEPTESGLYIGLTATNGAEGSLEVADDWQSAALATADRLLGLFNELRSGINVVSQVLIEESVILRDHAPQPVPADFIWEKLTPSNGRPLACRSDFHLVHSVTGAATAQALGELNGPLRVLAVGCAPADLPMLNLGEELNHIRAAVRERVRDGSIELLYREVTRRDHLIQAMSEVKPDVFHFIGHTIERRGRRLLALGGAVRAQGLELSETTELLSHAGVRCTVLNACRSDSIAHYLASQGLAALGMRDDIRDRAGRTFAQGFYQSLADGRSLASAVTEGRFRLHLEDLGGDSWSLPVLYVARGEIAGFKVDVEPVPLSQVLIECASPGTARVFVNDEPQRGLTPLNLKLRLNYPHEIRLERPGYQAATRIVVPVQRQEVHTIDLTPRQGRLSVRLFPAVANATVRCQSVEEGNPPMETRTDGLGNAEFDKLLVGDYRVAAAVEMPQVDVHVEEGREGTSVELTLPPELHLLDGLNASAQSLLAWLRRPVASVAVSAVAALLLLFVSSLWASLSTDESVERMVRIGGQPDYQVLGMDLDEGNTLRHAEESDLQLRERIANGNHLIREIREIVHASDVDRFWGDSPSSYNLATELFVDRTEVTVAAYNEFLESILQDPSRLRRHPRDDVNVTVEELEPEEWAHQLECLDCPVTGVDFFDAWAFAAFHGKRLPKHEEWEMAARGKEGRLFPWGNHYAAYLYNGYSSNETVVPVASPEFEASKTPEGLYDMAGNVDEWVVLHESETILRTAIVGGSFLGRGALSIIPYGDFEQVAGTARNAIGFRCFADTRVDLGMVRIAPGRYPLGGLNNFYFDQFRKLDAVLPGNLAKAMLGEEPQQVEIESFYLDESEVQVSDYALFLDALRAKPGLSDSLRHTDFAPGMIVFYGPDEWEDQLRKNRGHPVTGVNWYMADAYCRWQEKRLPTIYEFELAMGGPSARLFPTGARWRRDALIERYAEEIGLINISELGEEKLISAKDQRYRDSGELYHIYGNVSEWVVDPRYRSGENAFVKGGNFEHSGQIRTLRFFKELVPKDHKSERIGFRCAKNS